MTNVIVIVIFENEAICVLGIWLFPTDVLSNALLQWNEDGRIIIVITVTKIITMHHHRHQHHHHHQNHHYHLWSLLSLTDADADYFDNSRHGETY